MRRGRASFRMTEKRHAMREGTSYTALSATLYTSRCSSVIRRDQEPESSCLRGTEQDSPELTSVNDVRKKKVLFSMTEKHHDMRAGTPRDSA